MTRNRDTRRARIIEQLRKRYGGKWRWDVRCHQWVSSTGQKIYCCAALAPRFDGDDDSFEVQYRDRATGELVGMGGLIWMLGDR